jgi:hypothetical protein
MMAATAPDTDAGTELRELGGRYELVRDGRTFFIQGAGGVEHLPALAEAGANTIRTWGTNQTEAIIDEAHRLGLAVCAGLWIEHERRGADYGDPAFVAAEIEKHTRAVDRFKDHPALLLWGVGNEVTLNYTDERVWDVVEAVARYIREVDPRHPVMTTTAHVSAREVALIKARCPSIQILGVNSYAGLRVLARDIRAAGWDGPYIVGEWGPDGNWEVARTPWGAEIEPSSTEKAFARAIRYSHVLADAGRCLGSFAFYWGQKQEATPTWFNLFLEDGTPLEGVEVLRYLWSSESTVPGAPRIGPLMLDGRLAHEAIQVEPGAWVAASFALIRGDPAAAGVTWELLPESVHKGLGGDAEIRPSPVPVTFVAEGHSSVRFEAPPRPGAYRLFVYVRGAGNRAATANLPFFVGQPE